MTNNIIASLDVGSNNIRIVVAQNDNNEYLKILGAEEIVSAGVRRGAVIDIKETSQSIMTALEKIGKKVDFSVRNVVLGVGGTDIKIQETKGVVAISRANGEVEKDDINRVLEAAKNVSMPVNNEIIHAIPKEYKLDDQANIRNPLSMNGIRLEADVLMIEDSISHLDNLTKSVEQAKINVEGLAINSLAASSIVLDKNQKELGVAIVDIGSETTSVAVFEEGDLINVSVLPVGAGHITNDIAIGLRIPVSSAERIKLEYGSAFPKQINKRENIDLSEINSEENGLVSRYYVAEIIEARIIEIFEMVNAELKKMGRAGLLPSGVVLIGGGAEMPDIIDLAKDKLELPVKIGYPLEISGVLNKVDSPSFSTAVGLLSYYRQNNLLDRKDEKKYLRIFSSVGGIDITGIKTKVKKWIDRFLP